MKFVFFSIVCYAFVMSRVDCLCMYLLSFEPSLSAQILPGLIVQHSALDSLFVIFGRRV